jgi:DNA-binding XRE family transcriptional regulator
MPNIASVLKQEISRIARKESRSEIEAVKKATVQHRRYIAALRQQVKLLERQVATLKGKEGQTSAQPAANGADGPQVRFVAKGLRSLRERLDLTVAEMARLVGVSGQTVYNWEAKVTKPRSEQLKAIAELRSLGKREARNRLEQESPA